MLNGRLLLLCLLVLLTQSAALWHAQSADHDAGALECQVFHACQASQAITPSLILLAGLAVLWCWRLVLPSVRFTAFQFISHWQGRAPPFVLSFA